MNAKQAFYLGLYDRTFGQPIGAGFPRQDFQEWSEKHQEAYVAGLDPTAKVSEAVLYEEAPAEKVEASEAPNNEGPSSASVEALKRLAELRKKLSEQAPRKSCGPSSVRVRPVASKEDSLVFVLYLAEVANHVLETSRGNWREPLAEALKKLQEEQGLEFVVLKKSLEPEVA